MTYRTWRLLLFAAISYYYITVTQRKNAYKREHCTVEAEGVIKHLQGRTFIEYCYQEDFFTAPEFFLNSQPDDTKVQILINPENPEECIINRQKEPVIGKQEEKVNTITEFFILLILAVCAFLF